MYKIFAVINFHDELIFTLAIQPRILDTQIISLILKMSAIAKILLCENFRNYGMYNVHIRVKTRYMYSV